MSISREDVVHVARLARLELSEDEIKQFTVQLSDIIDHAARIQALDTEGIEPTAHPLPLSNILRDDEPGPTLDREVFLSQAPACEDGYVKVPRILDDDAGGPGGGT